MNTMVCMPERRNVTKKRHFLTSKTRIRRNPFHPKMQYDPICKPKKRGSHQEPHESGPQRFLPKGTSYVT